MVHLVIPRLCWLMIPTPPAQSCSPVGSYFRGSSVRCLFHGGGPSFSTLAPHPVRFLRMPGVPSPW